MKVKNYNTFWVILAIYAALVPISFIGISQINFPFLPGKSELFGFPTVWNYITWTASWWNILLGVLVVILVCNDIAFKTQRQEVIDGLSRKQFILGKLYFMIVLAFVIAFYTFIVGAILGFIYSSPSDIFQGLEFVGIYFIQTLGYFSFAFFFGVLVRKPALSIILFVVIIMMDGILGAEFILGNYAQYVPTIAISELTPFPFFSEVMELAKSQDANFEEPYVMPQSLRAVVSLISIAGFVIVGYLSLKRRDL